MRLEGKVSGIFFLRDRDFGGVDRDCFPCMNQRYGRWGQVRGEEVLCCQFKPKID